MFRTGNNPEPARNGEERNRGENASFPSGSQHPAPSSASLLETSTTRATTESETLAREIKDGTLSGFVGSGTAVKGETSFKGMMRIDGHVSGHLSSEDGTIIVGDGGHVDADLTVAIALIRGTVNGNISATQKIELGRTAKVTGNIETASLSIDHGAFFEGHCRMLTPVQKPVKPTVEAERPKPTIPDRDKPAPATASAPSPAPVSSPAAGINANQAPKVNR
jgi:cytoskeletal protein CcmA (bactofilin family)